jgi:transcription initiation factor TFIIIB Brf1 subunit/transcription initiation factor TFIIB
LGTSAERNRSKHSRYLNRLSKIHNSQTKPRDGALVRRSLNEIRRVLSALELPRSFEEPILRQFKQMYKRLKKNSKFRAPRKMVPVIIFYYCRKRNIPLNTRDLLNVGKISGDEFRRGRCLYLKEFSEYFSRDRVALIKNYIRGIKEKFDLGTEFYKNVLRIAQYFWNYLRHTTDAVIAGFSSSVTVLCDYETYQEKVTINEICREVNIRASTVNARISNTIVKQLNIEGFESPVKSHRLINTYIHKFEIIPSKEDHTEVEHALEGDNGLPEGGWAGFEDALSEMQVEVGRHFAPIPSPIVNIDGSWEGTQERELHIFRLPSKDHGRMKRAVIQLAPRSREVHQTPERFEFTAQKGPPWKDAPIINPG